MKILLSGGRGMFGQSLIRLKNKDFPDIEIEHPTSDELNLLDRQAVQQFFNKNRFDIVIHAAAKVGGIKANINEPTEFLTQNILMNTNIIEEALNAKIENLIFFGSSCMYPRNYRNPLVEEDILAAPLEPTNEGYALAKIVGQRLCTYISKQYGLNYRTLIPCNLYGPNDHFDPYRGHLIAAAMLKIQTAIDNGHSDVEIWGDGTARREFLYVDDLSRFILENVNRLKDMPNCLNLGLGHDYTVNEYYEAIANIAGFKGKFTHNLDAPVGMAQKLMSSEKATQFGWDNQTPLKEGIEKTYQSFLEFYAHQNLSQKKAAKK